jgi:serine/threonine-protein kinase
MAIASASSLVETLSRGRLLEPFQLEELVRSLPSRPVDPLVLARELLQRGWLTPYQINQLFQGRAADLTLGRYLLLERLGEGGMGQVFKARERRLGRVVALKVLRKERIDKPDIVRRFYHEIQAAARLSHPNIVHAYDAEQVGDAHLFSMEYIDGIDLARLLKQSGPLPVAQACEYVRQAALALQHIQEHGMVHRDIKPANLMRDNHGGGIKVLDMGLVRLLDDDSGVPAATKLTRLGAVMGTVDYIAPEQALNSHKADIRSDLYSLGCTLYHLLTGRVPFPADEPMAKLLAHSCDRALAVEHLRPDVPPPVADIVRKLMAKHPNDRHQRPAELVLDLASLTPPPHVVSSLPSPVRVPAPDGRTGNGKGKERPTRRRSQWWIAAVVILSPLLIALLAHLIRGWKQAAPAGGATESHAVSPNKEITNSLGMKLVRIAPGKFFMGSPQDDPNHRDNETPAHEVTITQPFYLAAHLVTVRNFRDFVEATGYQTEAEKDGDTHIGQYWLKPGWKPTDTHPVACLSWNDATAFCAWLTKKENRTYRLPTEAEWEYACRAGTKTVYFFGDDDAQLDEHGWHRRNSGDKAHPVGELKPNPWGLYDMHGNLLQWCGDWYDAKFYDKSDGDDPRGPTHGSHRVLRGGSWNSTAPECRSAYRAYNMPNTRSSDRGGFRVVLVSPD